MNIINKVIMLVLMSISLIAFSMKSYATTTGTSASTSANGDYGLSCTNTAYGTQHGGIYIAAGNNLTENSSGTNGDSGYGVYVGQDCVYAGAGRTNSSAIVGGEIARAAANAVVGAVTNRLSTAMAMNNDTAAHMSYSNDGNGIGMAANHIIGGLSVWTSFSSSNFDNDQLYSSVQLDSNQFEGDASAVTIGVDKAFGNIIVGASYTGFESDIETKVNGGDVKADGETMGIYVGLNTGPLMISAGAGTGEYDMETTRKDLGSLATITAKDITADVEYYHLNITGTVSRGKLSFSPRVAYRSFDLDIPAFTDIVPSDTNTFISDTSTSADENTTADEAVAAKGYSADMSEVGISIALSAGSKLIPFIDIAYVNEDSTGAAYGAELANDDGADLSASNPDGYMTYGGGVMLNLSGNVNGHLSVTETQSRDDFSETTVSGALKINF